MLLLSRLLLKRDPQRLRSSVELTKVIYDKNNCGAQKVVTKQLNQEHILNVFFEWNFYAFLNFTSFDLIHMPVVEGSETVRKIEKEVGRENPAKLSPSFPTSGDQPG